MAAPRTMAITVEIWEDRAEPQAAPPVFEEVSELEPLPEIAPMADLDPVPEPERIPDPVPVKKPPPPKPKARAKVQSAPMIPSPVAAEAAAPAVATRAVTTTPKANPNESKKFISDFLRLVEKSKFYPNQARRDNVTGTVKVRVGFTAQGEINSIALVPGDYDQVLGQAALSTMEKVKSRWRAKSGAPNSLVVPIAFKLR
jgi:protein TonB